MNPLILIFISLLAFVIGQFLLKLALDDEERAAVVPAAKNYRAAFFVAGIGSLTLSFFITLGLLQKQELSYVFPFQGFSVIIVTLGSSIFLKERLTAPLAIGSVLITLGLILVSSSEAPSPLP
jgi:uncharacterized membrane protein